MSEAAGRRRAARAALLALLPLGAACSTDTSGLERREPEITAQGGASPEVPSSAGGVGPAGAGGGSGEPSSPALNPSAGAVTIVHGLVDGGNVFVCLRDLGDGQFIGSDTAQPPGGIAYAESVEVPTTWDLAQRDVEALLIVASPSRWAGAACSELSARAVEPGTFAIADAGAPDAGALPGAFADEPIVPRRAGAVRFAPSVLRPGIRYALVAAGCTSGGAGGQPEACGASDGLFGAYASLLLAEIAEERAAGAASLGLQFVNASRAVELAEVSLQSERQQASSPLSDNVRFGVVRPARAAVVAEPIGVELRVQRESLPSYTQPWADTVAASGSGAVALGENHLLIYVGPQPASRVAAAAPPRFVLVR